MGVSEFLGLCWGGSLPRWLLQVQTSRHCRHLVFITNPTPWVISSPPSLDGTSPFCLLFPELIPSCLDPNQPVPPPAIRWTFHGLHSLTDPSPR